MKKSEICSKLEEELNPILEISGYEIVYLDCLKRNNRQVICVFIDKPEGITLNDCERVSKIIDSRLEELDIIKGPYFLEVCSPGLDRPLIKDKDFLRFRNKKIKVKTKEPLERQKNFIGILKEFENGTLKLEVIDKKQTFLISRDNILKANLVIDI